MNRTVMFLVVIVTAALPTSEYLQTLNDDSPTSNLDLQSLRNSSSLKDYDYRYKIFKRSGLRHRRDVSELPSKNKYLHNVQLVPAVADFPVFFDGPLEAKQESSAFLDDGYRYKTLQLIHYRYRRHVN